MTPASPTSVPTYDLLVIGGGINGAGIARDAAGRGLSVLLCEKDDLAGHTSSMSTKLIHGGLRYLEHYEFGLVRKALIEREVLLRSAPHIMAPLRLVMPHDPAQRPAWLIRSGLFLYDHLAHRRLLPGSHAVVLARHPAGRALRAAYTRAFEFSDVRVDDARLVLLCAQDAAERGATIRTHSQCIGAERHGDRWLATLTENGHTATVAARALVNATGPWAAGFLRQVAHPAGNRRLRLVKGSHIIVPRLFDHAYAYLFQNADQRITFAIPYERDYTLIGTTDVDYTGDPGEVSIQPDEIEYLCEAANRYFRQTLTPADVRWTYAGVRPLLEDEHATAAAVTRDYQLLLDQHGGAPVLSVFGGKLTTFRKLAQEAVDQLAPLLGNTAAAWTHDACLPGGDIRGPRPRSLAPAAFDGFVRELQSRYHWLAPRLVARYARTYGTRTHRLLHGRASLADMGEALADGLYAAELEYQRDHEWARSADDALWRRTKLGLHLSAGEREHVARWFARHASAPAPG